MKNIDTLEKEQGILEICKRRLGDGVRIDEVEKFVMKQHSDEIWQKIHNNVLEHDNVLKRIRKKNQKFWMLISNPSTWNDKRGDYIVNEILEGLDDNIIQSWKIDGTKDITEQMKEGEMGIIKVSDDKRTKEERTDENGNIVAKLIPGIYGIFEIVKDEDGYVTYEYQDKLNDEHWYVNIKVINNFYNKEKIIPKKDAIGLLGKDVYARMGSGNLDKNIYNEVCEYQKSQGEN